MLIVEFSESLPRKHARPCVLDEECRSKALVWLRQNAYAQGQPVMTAARFATWVNNDLQYRAATSSKKLACTHMHVCSQLHAHACI